MWTFVTCDRPEVCTQVVKKMEVYGPAHLIFEFEWPEAQHLNTKKYIAGILLPFQDKFLSSVFT